MAKVGRPSDYSPEMTEKICALLIDRLTLIEICRREDMPAETTVYEWLKRYPEFQEKYARAREIQAEAWADEIIEVANDGRNDWTERQIAPGVVRHMPDQEVVNRSKLRVDTLKWLMSKRLPKKYGDKTTTEHTGPDGSPLNFVMNLNGKNK